jgi:hypothetical protein
MPKHARRPHDSDGVCNDEICAIDRISICRIRASVYRHFGAERHDLRRPALRQPFAHPSNGAAHVDGIDETTQNVEAVPRFQPLTSGRGGR